MDLGNYRPVGVLPMMSKVFEKETTNQIWPYFDHLFLALEKLIVVKLF